MRYVSNSWLIWALFLSLPFAVSPSSSASASVFEVRVKPRSHSLTESSALRAIMSRPGRLPREGLPEEWRAAGENFRRTVVLALRGAADFETWKAAALIPIREGSELAVPLAVAEGRANVEDLQQPLRSAPLSQAQSETQLSLKTQSQTLQGAYEEFRAHLVELQLGSLIALKPDFDQVRSLFTDGLGSVEANRGFPALKVLELTLSLGQENWNQAIASLLIGDHFVTALREQGLKPEADETTHIRLQLVRLLQMNLKRDPNLGRTDLQALKAALQSAGFRFRRSFLTPWAGDQILG